MLSGPKEPSRRISPASSVRVDVARDVEPAADHHAVIAALLHLDRHVPRKRRERDFGLPVDGRVVKAGDEDRSAGLLRDDDAVIVVVPFIIRLPFRSSAKTSPLKSVRFSSCSIKGVGRVAMVVMEVSLKCVHGRERKTGPKSGAKSP
jgi:hypothetical protein